MTKPTRYIVGIDPAAVPDDPTQAEQHIRGLSQALTQQFEVNVTVIVGLTCIAEVNEAGHLGRPPGSLLAIPNGVAIP